MSLKTVAVLDDDPALVDLYKTILQEEGYTVNPVPFTNDLETILNNIRSLQPVLLILDVYIPGVSGLEVLQGLQKPGGSTELPVLLCSAAHNEIVVMEQQLQQAGLVVPPVLEKPFDLDDFVSLINRLVGEPEV